MDAISESIRQEVFNKGSSKRMKIKTLLKLFGFQKRSLFNTTLVTESLFEKGLTIYPSLMRLGDHWEQTNEDWVYIAHQNTVPYSENIPNGYITTPTEEVFNVDGWFDSLQSKEFRTEKEVETKFILPLLEKLGYKENDRFDAMPVNAAHGSRKAVLEIDFALFDNETELLNNQVLLVVEAKKEFRLTKKGELEKAQRQTKSYSIWLGCHFGLVTDSRTIQVLDLMPNIRGLEVLFECERAELKSRFKEMYEIIGKDRLRNYYLKYIQ